MSIFAQMEKIPALERVRQAASRDALSPALLFTGEGDLVSAARYAAAAMECRGEGARPCGVCDACRKVLSDIHPDVITVRDDGHKTLSAQVVRSARSDAYIRPNEGRRKVYLFPDCSLLTETDQNILLKVVEEGPPYAAFLFCAKNSASVLPTLRSRCVELKLPPEEAPGQGQAPQEEAAALCRVICRGAPGEAAALLAGWERSRMDRDTLRQVLEGSREILASILVGRYGGRRDSSPSPWEAAGAKNLTNAAIMRTITILQTYGTQCAYNVGVNHVLGALAVELEGIL